MEPDAAPPARTRGRRGPRGPDGVSGREYVGCGLWVAAFLVLVVLSFSIGVMLRPDEGPDTLTEGGTGSGAYRLEGQVDEADDPCVTLFRPDDEAEVAGQCGFTVPTEEGPEAGRYLVTSAQLPDGTTVVFAPVPRRAEAVRLQLSDGSRPRVAVRHDGGADLSWFVYETQVAVDGPAELLDGHGDPIDPP